MLIDWTKIQWGSQATKAVDSGITRVTIAATIPVGIHRDVPDKQLLNSVMAEWNQQLSRLDAANQLIAKLRAAKEVGAISISPAVLLAFLGADK